MLVENLSGVRIKALRSDRGGDFTSKEFFHFCEENGIRRFLTAPYQSSGEKESDHTRHDSKHAKE